MSGSRSKQGSQEPEVAAGNGLLDRRAFLRSGAAMAAAMIGYTVVESARAAPLPVEPWMQKPGAPLLPYDKPSRYEDKAVRGAWSSRTGFPEIGSLRTPHHLLNGTITPNGLHFSRVHTGVPDINPDAHRLLIHGLVKRPLIFTLDTLARYPMESHIFFLECGGNGELLYQKEPAQVGIQRLHGQVSCAEWTGVKLAVLLEEAGLDPRGKWIVAEGADASAMSRSAPLDKILDHAMIALYQNGERVMPSNGYPMRLLLPGMEGNANVKWLRRVKVLAGPAMTRDETSKYTITKPDGKSLQFVLPIEAKSIITQPAPELALKGPGLYQILGLAWSGYGKIVKVEVSADGGKSWAQAELQQPVRPLALVRFRIPWRWNGGPAVLLSRATDDSGYVQPTRDKMIANRGQWGNYHANCITSWGVSEDGVVKHVYI